MYALYITYKARFSKLYSMYRLQVSIPMIIKDHDNTGLVFPFSQQIIVDLEMPALNITIVSASDLRETEFFGSKQDPFVIIQTDCDNCKTATHMDGGKNPGTIAVPL